MNLINAARKGDLKKVNEILANGKVDPAANSNEALRWAAFNGHFEVVDCLLAIPKVAKAAAVKDNYALCWAAENGHFLVVDRLLAIPAVEAAAAVAENEALREAAANGHHTVVERLLAIPAVEAAATAFNNEALRAAQMGANSDPESYANYQSIIDRLMQIPAVATLAQQQANQTMDLADRTQFTENSMHPLKESQLAILRVLKKHYQERYQTLDVNWELTVAQIKSYLEDQYRDEPAKDNLGNQLPINYSAKGCKKNAKFYYQHKIHSAWRYLSVPNPWMSEAAGHVGVLKGKGRYAIISDGDKEIINYLWLALNDEAVLIEERAALAQNKYIFAESLAHLARAHNWDKKRKTKNAAGKIVQEYYDDLAGDKPACAYGVIQRLLEVPYKHPYLVYPELRELNAEIMNDRLSDWLCDPQNEDHLLQKIDRLDKDTQEKIYHCVDGIVMGNRPREDLLKEAEEALKISEEATQKLISQAREWFGAGRINLPTAVYYNEFFGSHAGYIPLIRHLISHPIDAFAKNIFEHLSPRFTEPALYTPVRDAQKKRGVAQKNARPNFRSSRCQL